MHSFLKNTAKTILEQHTSLENLVIVLPNRRAGLFFTQHLGVLTEKPIWMPEVKTIEDVFYQLAGLRPADNLTLIFELYKVYQSLNEEAESFDKFYFWGEMILKDFNDVDQFLVDATKLYHHLSEIKELEADLSFLTDEQIELIRQFWNSFQRQDKQHQEKFLRFWQILSPLYSSFQAALDVSGLAYSGKLYRKVAESLEKIPRPEKKYLFVGFNAFTGAEEKLIKHFISEFEAGIYWDIDAYYLEDRNQEAGMFFREYQKDKVFGPTFPKEIPQYINDKKANIQFYATPLKSNQANLVGAVLEAVGEEENWEETVVILPDEQMLFPVLHALPPTISKVNVTMGYPIRNAPVYAFLESVLEMQRFIKMDQGKVYFYHQQVKNLLSSIYLKSTNPGFSSELLVHIQEHNMIYVPLEKLHEGGSFFQKVFLKLQSAELFTYLSDLIQELAHNLEEEPLQRSYLFQCFKQLNRLREILDKQSGQPLELDFLIRIFRQIFREVKLPFEGEPLQGLQIMGVLESRNLDFRRLIICNLNEGSFPPSGGLNSMIPFNIRRAFGLPVQEQNDAIYAYTFYRLLHSAEEVHLIYTTASDQGKAGEKSRYIQQMLVEMGLNADEKVVFVPIGLKNTEEITIQKNEEIMRRLTFYKVDENGNSLKNFSPSALNIFLDCRLKFYLRYVAGIKEKEEVKEEVDASVFGNIAHYSMESLYEGFIERKKRIVLEKDDFEDLRKNWVKPAIEKGVRKFYKLEEDKDTKLNGQIAIVRDVLHKYIYRLLEIDEAAAPLKILSMEKRHAAAFRVKAAYGDFKVSLEGVIDRVDQVSGTIRMIDYKSGADKKDFTDIASLFDRAVKKRNKAAMQTLYYGLLYQSMYPENKLPLKPAIFNFKEIFKDDFNPYLQDKGSERKGGEVQDYRDYQEEFEQSLTTLLEDLFDESVPFDQTEDLDKCRICPFKEICGR
ncbi:PD-(D/E)XK nuclease family protein [Cecembia calidifontis]|uniref:PD-(D/E)XK nuclease superfamily protein n=1 Tax=Cecembia calidifontis TaxID=1187080 RepID=A0A4Q7PBW0_9BACT|nr:PD-(D/E)XK nuclease family protein [Cecembia calidifontis]RZS97060.1 PD-(D/E)XK nuclease superfamily protein [Cecembia calidifontis]